MSGSWEFDTSPAVLGPGPRTTVRRRSHRGTYDRAQIHAIIDAALICHVAFVFEGEAHVLPTTHARRGDRIVLHGARANRMLQAALQSEVVCISFTHVDGLVLARSAYHHSMNYRSAVIYGKAVEITDAAEKRAALTALVEHVAPGRSREVRPPSPEELKLTRVLAVDIREASAKTRGGPVADEPEDVAAGGVWAGVLPLALQAGVPERDADCVLPLSQAASVVARAVSFGGEPLHEAHDLGVCFSSDRSRLDLHWVHQALTETYWAKGVDFERVRRSFQRSLSFGVYGAEGVQLGCARVISDGARIGYLADVFVDPAQRGQGIGRRLIRHVLEHPEVRSLDRLLLKTVDAQSLYARLGFVLSDTGVGMVRRAS